jgi:hypothetical protein
MGNRKKGGEEGEFLDGGGKPGGPDKDLNLVTPAYRLSLFWIFWEEEGGKVQVESTSIKEREKRND